MGIRKTPLEKEWAALEKKEARFLASRTEKADSRLNQLLAPASSKRPIAGIRSGRPTR